MFDWYQEFKNSACINVYILFVFFKVVIQVILDSIVVSIPICYTGDRGSIPANKFNFFNNTIFYYNVV